MAARADHYARFTEHPQLLAALADAQVLIGGMSPTELREAVIRPAETRSARVEGALVATIVAEVAAPHQATAAGQRRARTPGSGRYNQLMVDVTPPLNECQVQVQVLSWIGDGCPDGVMNGHTHKTTAIALQGVVTTPDPSVALQFGKAVFLCDYRPALAKVTVPTLVLQHRSDPLVPQHVGEYLHRHINGSRFELLDAADDLPPSAASHQTIAAIHRFLDDTPVSPRR